MSISKERKEIALIFMLFLRNIMFSNMNLFIYNNAFAKICKKTPTETVWSFKLWNAFVFDIIECKRRVWIAVLQVVGIFPADFSETKLGFVGELVD